MEYDLDTALAVSLIHSKPDGMDIVDYITGIQTKIVEKESKLFVEVCKQIDDKFIKFIQSNTEFLILVSLSKVAI